MNPRDIERIARRGLIAALLVAACTKGSGSGEVKSPPSTTGGQPPAPAHEQVKFTWESGEESDSGRIQATLPTGETFKGKFHQIITTVPIEHYSELYGGWYAGPWAGPSWYWGGAWPYYGTAEEFVTHYTDRVVARLTGDQGHEMRCHFTLNDRLGGMKAGGAGECQVSNGERITAKFDPT